MFILSIDYVAFDLIFCLRSIFSIECYLIFSFKTITFKQDFIVKNNNCIISIMKLKVTTLTGDKHELEVAPQDTVKQLRVGACILWN